MALPPSGLTQLLYATDGSAKSAVSELARAGCLSPKAIASIDKVKAYLERVAAAHTEHFARLGPGASGPSLADAFVEALKESSFLSSKGIALSRE